MHFVRTKVFVFFFFFFLFWEKGIGPVECSPKFWGDLVSIKI
jgi:hypothetical protein